MDSEQFIQNCLRHQRFIEMKTLQTSEIRILKTNNKIEKLDMDDVEKALTKGCEYTYKKSRQVIKQVKLYGMAAKAVVEKIKQGKYIASVHTQYIKGD